MAGEARSGRQKGRVEAGVCMCMCVSVVTRMP